MKKVTLIIIAALFFSSASFAQDSKFKSVGISAGIYSPGMDYFERLNQEFKSGFSGSINAEYWISNDFLSVRAGIGYFTSTAKNTNLEFPQETTVSLVPFILDVLAYKSLAEGSPLTLYGGMGVDFNSVSTEYKSPLSTQSPSGGATTFHLILGMEYGVTDNISIGPELQYVFGGYDQTYSNPDASFRTEEINLDGMKIGVQISYKF